MPIPGTKRRTYLESNVAAADIDLTGDDVKRIETAFPANAAAGERYTPEMMRWVDKTSARA